mmetsp:Transcript_10202/g.41545  ORF Transcript_10202/g.41545 Transcript_10202/m.41545 type:complete len:308 (-) Transcript_10202:554-1477(-)
MARSPGTALLLLRGFVADDDRLADGVGAGRLAVARAGGGGLVAAHCSAREAVALVEEELVLRPLSLAAERRVGGTAEVGWLEGRRRLLALALLSLLALLPFLALPLLLLHVQHRAVVHVLVAAQTDGADAQLARVLAGRHQPDDEVPRGRAHADPLVERSVHVDEVVEGGDEERVLGLPSARLAQARDVVDVGVGEDRRVGDVRAVKVNLHGRLDGRVGGRVLDVDVRQKVPVVDRVLEDEGPVTLVEGEHLEVLREGRLWRGNAVVDVVGADVDVGRDCALAQEVEEAVHCESRVVVRCRVLGEHG